MVDPFQGPSPCHILHQCIKSKDLGRARRAHSIMIQDNVDRDEELGSCLVRVFGLFFSRSLIDANLAFCRTLNPDLAAWQAIICAYESLGEYRHVIYLYGKLQEENNNQPDKLIFLPTLKACGSIQDERQGLLVHQKIVQVGLDIDVTLGTTLVDMYCKLDDLRTGHRVFDNLRNRNVVTWGALIDGYARHGDSIACLELFSEMHREGFEPNKVIFLSVLKACHSLGDLWVGKSLHDWILQSGLELDALIECSLIDMYAKNGSIKDAEYVFGTLKQPDVVSYGTMISGYIQHGDSLCALRLFTKMEREGTSSNNHIFSCALKACGNMKSSEQVRILNDKIVKYGFELGVVVGTALVDAYVKCECLGEAMETFESLPSRNAVSWSVIILGCAQHDCGFLSFQFFDRMIKDGVIPTSATLLNLLKACVTLGSLSHGRMIHDRVIEGGFEQDTSVGSALVDMYTKCGSIEDARNSFDCLPKKSIVSWGAMMWGYVDQGQGSAALDLLEKMHEDGIEPNKIAFLSALKACESLRSLVSVTLVHDMIIKNGFELDTVIGSATIDMYSLSGSLSESRKVFDMLETRDVVAWSAIIAAYCQHDDGNSAVELFKKMQLLVLKPDAIMISAVIKAYRLVGNLVQGMLIHHQTTHGGHDHDCAVRNTLVHMYATCGSVKDAEHVFIGGLSSCDAISWGAMIEAYVQSGDCLNAVQLLGKMQLHGIEPDAATFVSVLKACGCGGSIQQRREIHEQVTKYCLDSDGAVTNALLDMYVKCGNLEQAFKLFNHMKEPDVISWGTMIVGFVQHGLWFSALLLYEKMLEQGIQANEVMLPCILKACGMIGATDQGMHIHDLIIRSWLEDDMAIGRALLGMYAKFGKPYEARKVLDDSPHRDVKSWNAMLSGYVEQDECKPAMQFLEGIQQDGLQLHSATHMGVLAACPHIVDVKEVSEYFLAMREEQWVSPGVEHVNCMISLLSTSGQLYEAEQLIYTMPASSSIIGWTSLLDGCRKYGMKRLAKRCFAQSICA